MTIMNWEGGIEGTIVLNAEPQTEAHNVDRLMEVIRARSFSSTDLYTLGHVLFYFALRDAFDNDPLLPAANRVLDGAYTTLSHPPDRHPLEDGIDSMRDHVFSSRHLTNREIIEMGFKFMSEKLSKRT